jgi:cysteinyl-tRNA synthetase
MALEIYNSQSQTKQPLQPLTAGMVKMYVCGPTVYDLLHVGNFRGPIFFNLVRNWLEHRGYKVTFVYNFTDVDDRIIKRAGKDGVSSEVIAQTYIDEFKKDFDRLKLRPHDHNPRVTEFIPQIVDFVQALIAAGKAYEIDGDVYYDVTSFAEYGKLSHKNLDDLAAGFRIDVDPRKHHVSDFALWKNAKPGEPSWPSPWGAGRPGWHIECSAMAQQLLGDSIDIHGGGMDLIFPHHENEIAQSEGRTGKPFVQCWMHNNMIQFGQAKMSKSLGNVILGRGFMDSYGPEILKFVVLSGHYRSPLDFTEASIGNAITGLARIYSALAHADRLTAQASGLAPLPDEMARVTEESETGFGKALDDDFNTPEALARIFEVVRVFNGLARKPGRVQPSAIAAAETLKAFVRSRGELMALFQEPAAAFLEELDNLLLKRKNLDRAQIAQKVESRTLARTQKDFAKSDEIRDELLAMGIRLLDSPEGTVWEVDK